MSFIHLYLHRWKSPICILKPLSLEFIISLKLEALIDCGKCDCYPRGSLDIEFRIDLVPGATPVAKSPYRLAPSEMQELSEQLQELQDKVINRMRVKPRRVRAMAMTIQYGVRGMILAAQRAEKRTKTWRHSNLVPWVEKDIATYVSKLSNLFKSKEWNSGDDQLRSRWIIYLVVLADAAECVRDAIGFEYCLASSSGWTNYHSSIQYALVDALYGMKCRPHVLWTKIRESSLIGPMLVQETTDKVMLIKEKLKAARDRQKSYADNRRKPLEFEVGDRVMLKVSPWKGVVHFGKKGKLAPRYVGPFEILERNRLKLIG
ncbi:hypothetical protein Tco_1226387 [Tanacetum coccineum]